VSGICEDTNTGVRIDYVLYPKEHLIKNGFKAAPFGVEVKHIPHRANGFTHKNTRLFWQAISYMRSRFSLPNKQGFKLKYVLVFTNLSFHDELALLDKGKFNSRMSAICLANHANIGVLNIVGDINNYKGWSVAFGGSEYFKKRIYRDNVVLRKRANADNLINKKRVGNF